nr:flagellin [Pleomorphomonas sp. NRK KF1]
MPVISTNTAANSAVRYLNINAADQSASLSKLASGSRITQAADDAAGLAISTRISSDIATLNQAATNATQAVSVLQTADGGASNISDILERMKTLATQSASGTVTDSERTYIDAEFQELIEQIDTIATGTRFNGESLLDGTSDFDTTAGGTEIVVGSSADDTIKVSIDELTSSALDLSTSAANDITADLSSVSIGIGQGTSATQIVLTIGSTDDSGTATSVDVTLGASADTDGDGVLTGEEIGDFLTTDTTTTAALTAANVSMSYSNGTLTVSNSSEATGSSSALSIGVNTTATTGTTFDADADGTVAADADGVLKALGFTSDSSQSTISTVGSGTSNIDVTTQDNATTALEAIDAAIDKVSAARASIGAQESRFEFSSESIATSIENLSAANSAITDVDVASEEAKLASAEVKVQAAVAAASSANDMTQNLLKLLQ